MTSQSRMQDYRWRREKDPTAVGTAGADLQPLDFPSATTPPSATNSFWRQIDRWVNEGGAVGDASFAPEETESGRKS
jgi:hypothetical protein